MQVELHVNARKTEGESDAAPDSSVTQESLGIEEEMEMLDTGLQDDDDSDQKDFNATACDMQAQPRPSALGPRPSALGPLAYRAESKVAAHALGKHAYMCVSGALRGHRGTLLGQGHRHHAGCACGAAAACSEEGAGSLAKGKGLVDGGAGGARVDAGDAG